MTDSAQDHIVTRYGRAMRLVAITPDMAREWLATLGPHVAFNTGRVQRYAEMMRDGTWELMELPIVYRNGRLLSSRNRLGAIIESGLTVEMYVSDDECPA